MGDQQVDSIKKIADLRRQLPGVHLLVGHDHTEYQTKYLVPCLSKGWLSEDDRQSLRAYESFLFEGDGSLRPDAIPRFERDLSGGPIGTVSEPHHPPLQKAG